MYYTIYYSIRGGGGQITFMGLSPNAVFVLNFQIFVNFF